MRYLFGGYACLLSLLSVSCGARSGLLDSGSQDGIVAADDLPARRRCVASAEGMFASGPNGWRRDTGFPPALATFPLSLGQVSPPLEFSGYAGPFLPSAATITGITVKLKRGTLPPAGDVLLDHSVQLRRKGHLSEDRSGTAPWPAIPGWQTCGGSNDRWGQEWSPSDIVDPEFGFRLTVVHLNVPGTHEAVVEDIELTIYYSYPCD